MIFLVLFLLFICLTLASNLNFHDITTYSSSEYNNNNNNDNNNNNNNNNKNEIYNLNNLHDILRNSIPELKTGTTIVGICCTDGIVLGADTRSTGGALVMDKNKLKIHKISSCIYCCGAGTSAHCDYVTRKARHELGLYQIDNELAGESILESVSSALQSIRKSIEDAKASLQSVFILGGVDDNNIALYQIDDDGTSIRLGFAALGSGSTDAIAILETHREIWNNKSEIIKNRNKSYMENIKTDEAVISVRKAVQAGILNDLGSGSHVDLLIIQKNKVRGWRERLISSWDQDKEQAANFMISNDTNIDNDDNYNTTVRGQIIYKKIDNDYNIESMSMGIEVELLK